MRIRWTDPALSDFNHICNYSDAHFGLTRGRRTALQIFDAVSLLADFPRLGRLGRKPGTSELVMTGLPFIVVYRLNEEVVEIVRILHGAQRWP